MPARLSLLDLPLEVMNHVFSFLSVKDLSNLQACAPVLYNFIMSDSQFVYYNTLKFFELYYKQRLFALFLFQYIHPRYSYRVLKKEGTEQSPGNTAFHVAASNGLVEVLESFLSLEARNKLKFPKMIDSQYNHECLKHLSLKPENENCRLIELVNDEPNTALHYISIIPEEAQERDVFYSVRFLIRQGADLWKKGRAGNTALAEAAQHGQYGMVKLIYEEAKKIMNKEELQRYVNCYNDYHENSVILASRSSPRILAFLLSHGGDPDSRRRGYPLLSIAASGFQLDHRDPLTFQNYHEQRTTRWQSPWPNISDDDIEEENLSHERVMTILLQTGADPRLAEQGTGMTPLHNAALWGECESIDILMKLGNVDPNREINLTNGWLPIHYSCAESQIFAIQKLIQNGAKVWDQGEYPEYNKELQSRNIPLPPAPLELMENEVLKSRIKKFIKRNRLTQK